MSQYEREEERARRQSDSVIAPGADPVEPRDPAVRAVPGRPSTALLFVIPAIIIVLLGIGWMFLAERETTNPAPTTVEGTTGQEGADESPSDEGQQRPAENPAR